MLIINHLINDRSNNKYENSVDLLFDFFYKMKMCNPSDKDNKPIEIVDSSFPLCIDKKKKNYMYSRSLIVRSSSE